MKETHVVFTIRKRLNIREGLCLLYKKGGDTISKQEIADTVSEELENPKMVWSSDIEDFRIIEDKEELKELFKSVDDRNKFFMGR